MATIQDFESKLKEVVNAKRLSASKMEKLTEMSIKLMGNDTQLVSILYRTHKSLPASAKISSLYVFDAMCRAARSQTVKRNLPANLSAEKGNCATFLLKIDSVLDGLFQDVLSSGIPEAKEKTRKVLDIWTKSNTFPANVLTRLGAVDKVAESSESGIKEPKHAEAGSSTPVPVSDPRKQPTPPYVITPPPASSTTTPTAEAAQAALLALLTSAAGAKNPLHANQNPVNQPALQGVPLPQLQSQGHLGQLQAALLQQLSKNNNAVPALGLPSSPLQNQVPPFSIPTASPFLAQLNTSSGISNYAGPISPLSAGTQSYPEQRPRDPRPPRFDDTTQFRGRGERSSDRGSNMRGYRGGFRGRGRGEFRGPSERDREAPWERGSSYRNYENGPPPNRRRMLSRSRSPPPRWQEGRATYKSPPGSPSIDRNRGLGPESLEAGKDEFGRDIRCDSEESEGDRGKRENILSSIRNGDTHVDVRARASQSEAGRDIDPSTVKKDTSTASKPEPLGLDSFDISMFDPTHVESWQALGTAFQVTHGYVPSQEELMCIVMSNMGMMMGMGVDVNPNGDVNGLDTASGLMDSNGIFGEVDGAARGDGNGSERSAIALSFKPSSPHTDAVVLGSNEEDQATKETPTDPDVADTLASPTSNIIESIPSGSSGKMQKVGDRWVFVRGEV